jgi:hypothetical protein
MKRREQGSASELRSTMMIMMLREDFVQRCRAAGGKERAGEGGYKE